jgi:hypothetical protein
MVNFRRRMITISFIGAFAAASVTLSMNGGPASAQAPLGVEDLGWLRGEWEGVIHGSKTTRTLIVDEIGDPAKIAARYGISERSLPPLKTPSVARGTDGEFAVVFETNAKPPSLIQLKRITPWRMDGTFERDGNSTPIRFWKKGAPAQSGSVVVFVGSWEGNWRNGLDTKFRVDYIDATGASFTYWNGNLSSVGIRESWNRFNASIANEEFTWVLVTAKEKFTHRYRAGNNRLTGDCQPCLLRDGSTNSVVWLPCKSFPQLEP